MKQFINQFYGSQGGSLYQNSRKQLIKVYICQ